MVQTSNYCELVCDILLGMVVLGCIFKNVNISNNSRVKKRDVRSFSSQYILDSNIQNHVLDASLFEESCLS